MTTEHYLWAIFALLCLALVLVVVTARRGPWQRNASPATPCTAPPVGMACVSRDGQGHHGPCVVRGPIDQIRHISVLPPGVDPLWGKNRPEGS